MNLRLASATKTLLLMNYPSRSAFYLMMGFIMPEINSFSGRHDDASYGALSAIIAATCSAYPIPSGKRPRPVSSCATKINGLSAPI
ncbi:MAG: hypothetical protein H6651_07875 [Ardenticatenales bacterium]|nr:hypothetical protein [Ardenticatenales bacterium]